MAERKLANRCSRASPQLDALSGHLPRLIVVWGILLSRHAWHPIE